jgi:hypothetical protein
MRSSPKKLLCVNSGAESICIYGKDHISSNTHKNKKLFRANQTANALPQTWENYLHNISGGARTAELQFREEKLSATTLHCSLMILVR